jgi:hypothetical protein
MSCRRCHGHLLLFVSVLILGVSNHAAAMQSQTKAPPRDLFVEVLQVLELPLNVQDALLVKTDKGYRLRCTISNSSEVALTGLRYSLTVIDPLRGLRPVVNRTHGFSLAAYVTKTFTFQIPIPIKPQDGDRFVLMFEQAMSADSIWEVIKAKDALDAYVAGDYSVVPHVLRVANQVDAPPPLPRVIY